MEPMTGRLNGTYSVKAGYFLESKGFDPPQFQSSHSLQGWWKLLWKLCFPPKVKVFLWRASKNFIPTALNLFLKHASISGTCPLCKYNAGTASRCLLLFCKFVRPIWKHSIFWLYLSKLTHGSFIDLCVVNC